jgi:mycofactocin precursor
VDDQDVIETEAPPGRLGAGVAPEAGDDQAVVTGELLVEEISIDGMCGVY